MLDQYHAAVDALQPDVYGPTWATDSTGKWIPPEHTLGWEVIGWTAEWLQDLAGSEGPLKLTREQMRFVLWWYAVDDDGNFVYQSGVLQRLKGWGKDPLLAVMCLVEFVGPCRFGGWDEDGEPIAVPHPNPLVQIAATSQDQTTNTGDMFAVLMSQRLIDAYGIKPGIELIRADNGRRQIQLVTSNYRSLEGKRSTFVVLNETHHWIKGNGGIKMYETVDGNTVKMDGRYLSITNAYLPGEESVAELQRRDFEQVRLGLAVDSGLMYDSIEAHPDTPLTKEALEIVIPKIRGDAVWLNVETILKSIQKVSIAPARSRRMWLNQIVAGEDALHEPREWDAMARPGETLKPDDKIVLGFDGGRTEDATALIAIRVSDMFVWPLGIWQKPAETPNWEVDRHSVNSRVHEAFRKYTVLGMYCDVAQWESYLTDWQEAYGDSVAVKAQDHKPFEWDMRGGANQNGSKKVVMAHERLMASIWEHKIKHPGQSTPDARLLRSHVLNARRRESVYGLSFGKESKHSTDKVDAYAALMLAHECLYDYRLRGTETPDIDEGGWFF